METSKESEITETSEPSTSEPFKKPILIGKIGRLPKKVSQLKNVHNSDPPSDNPIAESSASGVKKSELENGLADSTGKIDCIDCSVIHLLSNIIL